MTIRYWPLFYGGPIAGEEREFKGLPPERYPIEVDGVQHIYHRYTIPSVVPGAPDTYYYLYEKPGNG